MKRAVIYCLSFPADLLAWGIVLVCRLLWGQRLMWKHGVLAMEFKQTSWPMRTWYRNWGGTTFGHGIIYAHKHIDWEPIWHHELVHVEQFEAACLNNVPAFLLLTSVGHPWLGLLWWVLSPLALTGASFVTAWLRGEEPYLGSHIEEAAYNKVNCEAQDLSREIAKP